MADPVLFKDAYVALGTATGAYKNLSASVKSVGFTFSRAELANSVMGDDAETFELGLETLKPSVTFRQDFGASGIDTRIYSWLKNGTKLYGIFKPVNASTSTTNPEFRVRVKVQSHDIMSGAHGTLLETAVPLIILSATSTSSAYNGITRSTSS